MSHKQSEGGIPLIFYQQRCNKDKYEYKSGGLHSLTRNPESKIELLTYYANLKKHSWIPTYQKTLFYHPGLILHIKNPISTVKVITEEKQKQKYFAGVG